jgi:hypothetical protein
MDFDFGHIYIVEFNKSQQLYKIDKTNEIKINDIMKQYPKNTKLIYSSDSVFVDMIKRKIIDVFNTKFKKSNKGGDYFIGNINEMLSIVNFIINDVREMYNKASNATFFTKLNSTFKNDTDVVSFTMESMGDLIDNNNVSLTPTQELYEYNIIREYARLEKNKDNLCTYDKAIYLLCEVIIDCVSHDRENGDYVSEENNEKIKKAGEFLNLHNGYNGMHDVLLSWVPKRYRREFDLLWDGIGEWRG